MQSETRALAPSGGRRSDGAADDVLAGGGECGAIIRALDWSRTPVGPVEQWPLTLRAILPVVLNSRYPMFLWWGPELVQFYNDGYRPSLGATRHPAAMG